MPVLDDSELQDLADLYEEEAMKDDCQISRKATTPSAYGNTQTPTVIATVKGTRKKPGLRLMQLYADRIGDMTAWEVSLPLGTDARIGDIILMAGDTMEVRVLLKQTWQVSCDVLATEVKV